MSIQDDNLRELFRAHRDAQNQHAYFLLAAAGAAIGFAVTQTQTARLQPDHAPLGVAVACWGLSFLFGCLHLNAISGALYANAAMLRILAGRDADVGTHPTRIAAASEGVRDATRTHSDRSARYAKLQFWLLIAGALAFIAWHVGQMYSRGVS